MRTTAAPVSIRALTEVGKSLLGDVSVQFHKNCLAFTALTESDGNWLSRGMCPPSDEVVDETEVSPKSIPHTGRSLSSSLPSSLIVLIVFGRLFG